MKQLDEIIQLLLDNIETDDRISLEKRIKYGCRHYYLQLEIDEDKTQKNINFFRDNLEIHFDGRNKCIEVTGQDNLPVIIEDEEMLNRWSSVFEKIIESNLDLRLKEKITDSLNACNNKSLLRQYQMKKLID